MMNTYQNRFGEQVETVTTETLLESWPSSAPARKASTACVIGTTWCDVANATRCRSRCNDNGGGEPRAGPSIAGAF